MSERKSRLTESVHNTDCQGNGWDLTMGEVYGYKSWDVDDKGRLVSPAKHHLWKPGRNTAFKREDYEKHYTEDQIRRFKMVYGRDWENYVSAASPHGFFAYYDKPEWPGAVRGMIKAYGYVAEGTRGFHAEHAEVYAIVDKGRPSGMPNEKSPFGWMVGKFADKYAKSDSETLAGWGITAMILMIGLAVATAIFGFALSLWPVALITVPLAIVFGMMFFAALRAENLVDSYDSGVRQAKKKWLSIRAGGSEQGRFTLRDMYPEARFYKSVSQMIRAESQLVEASKPKPPPVEVIPPTDERFWED